MSAAAINVRPIDEDERMRRVSMPGKGSDDVALTTGRFAMHEETSIPENMQFLYLEEEDRKIAWEMNYHEAAIYLQEGETFSMFSTHPKSQQSLPVYLLIHNTVYRVVNLLIAIVLLLLALFEYPTFPQLLLPIPATCAVEMVCLVIIEIEMMFRLKWMGANAFFTHPMSVMKSLAALALFIDALVLWGMMQPHFRILRAIRPLFLYDNYYCISVKAFCKYLLRSVPPVIEMVVLILYIIVVYAVLGFYLYVDIPYYSQFFPDFPNSFYSLFEFFTTVNYPDVMMPAYNQNRANAIFFISMICITLYFMMNLVTATVYGTFAEQQKQDVKKQVLHRREAARRAFRLLVTRNEPDSLSLRHFYGMMKYYKPRSSRKLAYIIFKTMNKSKTGRLSIDEFYNVYDISGLTYQHAKPDAPWYMIKCSSPGTIRAFALADRVLNSIAYNVFDYLVLTFNYVWIVYLTVLLSVKAISDVNLYPAAQPVALALLSFYSLDIIVKFIVFGPHRFVHSFWCVFDVITTIISWATQIINLVNHNFTCLLILRPIRLLKLLAYRKRYKDLSDTVVVMVSSLGSLSIVMITYLYFWSVVGEELFNGYNLTDCCKNTWVAAAYTRGGFYYDNNYNNIIYGMITLFELTVVNNWLIQFQAYALAISEWTRLFYLVFYFSTMVVLATVIAFFLEAFKMHMAFTKTSAGDDAQEAKLVELVYLSPEERYMCENQRMILTGFYIRIESPNINREIERLIAFRPDLKRKHTVNQLDVAQRNAIANGMGSARRTNGRAHDDSVDANTNASRRGNLRLPERELFVGEAYYSNLQMWLQIYSGEVTSWLQQEAEILKTRRSSYIR